MSTISVQKRYDEAETTFIDELQTAFTGVQPLGAVLRVERKGAWKVFAG